MSSEAKTDPAYLSQFCPILSHAMLAPAKPEAKPTVLAGLSTTSGGATVAEQPEAAEAEYVGCQGPACAFFVEGEGHCAIKLVPMALAAILFRLGTPPPTFPTSQH